MISRILAVVLAAAALPALAQEPPKCKLVRIAEWPVRLQGGAHPILEGSINGKKIGVLLDTGAYASVLTKSAAEKLDLPTRPTQEIVAGFGGTSRVFVTTIQELRLGEAVRNNWRVRVIGERPMAGVDFILGEDFFKLVDIEFDYAKSVVRVFQPENCKNAFLGYWDPNAHVVPIEDGEKIMIPVKVNGRAGRAMIDSGAWSSIVSLAFAEEMGITRDSPGVMPGNCSGGIGGNVVRNWVAKFDSVSIGNQNIRDSQIRISDYSTDLGARSRTMPPDMFLGGDFLKSHRLYVSRTQNKAYFTYTGGQVFGATAGIGCDERRATSSPKEQLAAYDQAIATNPNDTKALVQRAALRGRENDFPGALVDLDAILRIEPAHGVALAMRSAVRIQVKDFDGALADSDAAIAGGMATARIHTNRGEIWRSRGNCQRAIAEYEQALKLDPLFEAAKRGLSSCRGAG